ncbi:hypothetical protein [Stenotrophomonas oahuensis]|uniref:Uncharacterized protein n=1 Tax=Stenotrophomonas oahuensis TaxID=3003271 RepID=A0ABY9YN27_9GAMM|nr:hypothetical protein [Stenotrophomonas sp. A5586]WNH52303.1 hypothetical protein PDM29_18540 [Stenotrophomonas sp. A5586]
MNAAFLTLLVAGSCIGCQIRHSDETTSVNQCGRQAQPPCRVTFRALADNPQRFEGLTLRVEGYLAVSRGLFVLTSSKELFEAGASDEMAIRIRGPIDLQRQIFEQHVYTWVSVTGTYGSTVGIKNELLLGEIRAPLDVQPLRIPGPAQRATFGDVLIDLEDLK